MTTVLPGTGTVSDFRRYSDAVDPLWRGSHLFYAPSIVICMSLLLGLRGNSSRESSNLQGMNGRPCAVSILSTVEHYNEDPHLGKVVARTIKQVPWCLTSYDSRRVAKVLIDEDSMIQGLTTLLGPNSASSPLLELAQTGKQECGFLRQDGVEKHPKTWWELFTLCPNTSTVCHVLPVLSRCSMIGAITLNTEGEYLLTMHPKYGFFLFRDISFQAMAAVYKLSADYWAKQAGRCVTLRTGFYSGVVFWAGMFVFNRLYPGSIHRKLREWKRYLFGGRGGGNGGGGGDIQWMQRQAAARAAAEAASSHNNTFVNAGAHGGGGVGLSNMNMNMNMCVVCLSEARTVLVRPCLHLCLCNSCYTSNYTDIASTCPICREVIEDHEVVFNP